MSAFCSSCGTALPAPSPAFCASCGAAVAAARESQTAIPVPIVAGAVPRRKLGCLPIVGGALVVVIAVIGFALFATAGPADAVTAHLAAIARNDTAAAYTYTSTGFRSATSPAAFATFVAENPILAGKAGVTDRSVDGDTAMVTVELTGVGGERRTADFQLMKEGDKWLIGTYRVRALGATATPTASAARTGGAPTPRPMVACSSPATRSADPAPVLAIAPKTAIRLFTAPLTVERTSIRDYPDTKARTFSIAAQKARTGDTVHFSFVALADVPTDLPAHGIAIEVCDQQGQTVRAHGNAVLGSANSIGSDSSIAGGALAPEQPGTYRIDAYIWLESTKTWYLVGRMDGVTFTP